MGRLVYVDSSGREISVPFGPHDPLVTIGRAVECTIRSNQKSVSRRHAEFRYDNGQYQVADLGSSNGTFLSINNTRQHVEDGVYLTHDDEIWCGNFVLRFLEEEEAFYDDPGLSVQEDSEPTYADSAPLMYPDAREGYDPQPNGVYPPEQAGGYPVETYTSAPVEQSDFGSSSYPPPVDDIGYQSGGGNFNPDPLSSSGPHSVSSVSQGPSMEMEELISLRQKVIDFEARQHRAELETRELQQSLEQATSQLDEARAAQEQVASQLAQVQQERDTLQERVEQVSQTERGAELESLLRHNEELLKERDGLRRRSEVLEKDLLELRERIESYRRRATNAEEEASAASKLREELKVSESLVEQLRQDQTTQRESKRALRDELDRAKIELTQAKRDVQVTEDLREELARARRLLDEAERRGRTLQKEKEELEEEAERLQQALQAQSSDAESLKTLTANYEKRISQLTNKNTALERESAEFRQSSGSVEEALAAQRKEFLAQTHDFKALKESSAKMIEELQASLSDREETLVFLTKEHEALSAKVEELEPELRTVRAEAEGLKQRLKLRKDKKVAQELEEVRQQRDELQSKLQELEAAEPEQVEEASAGALGEETKQDLRAIARIMEALGRADLDKLKAVDRIRLKKTLEEVDATGVLEKILGE